MVEQNISVTISWFVRQKKKKVNFLAGWLFSSQSKLFKKLLEKSDWLEKWPAL